MASNGIWELPEDWGVVKLGQLVEMKTGFACAKTNLVADGLPHLRPFNISKGGELNLTEIYHIPEDFQSGVDEYAIETGHVLFNNTNSVELVGKTAIVRQPLRCAYSNHLTRLTILDRSRIEPEWLALTLKQLWTTGFFAANCNKWIGQAGFNTQMLSAVEVPLPDPDTPTRSLAEQRRIVARIEELFDRLDEARRLRAVANGDTEELLNATLDQVLGEVSEQSPKIVPLGEFANAFNGRASGSGESDVRVFKTKHVYPFNLKQSAPSFMKPDQIANCPPDRYLRSGDVLVCNIARGTLGRVCYVDVAQGNWTVDTQIMILRVNERCLGKWLFYFLYSRHGQAEILAREKGIAFADKRGQTHLYPSDMKTVPVSLPSLLEQYRLVEYLDNVQSQVKELKRQQLESSVELERFSGAILSRAFRGEL